MCIYIFTKYSDWMMVLGIAYIHDTYILMLQFVACFGIKYGKIIEIYSKNAPK